MPFSYYSNLNLASKDSKLPSFRYKDLKITKTTAPKTCPPYEKLLFGQNASDHMLVIDWEEK